MAFVRVLGRGVPKDEVCIDGRSVYIIKHKPLKSGHAKTEAYIDSQRRLDARMCVKGLQEEIRTKSPPPTAQLRGLSVSLEVVSYRK